MNFSIELAAEKIYDARTRQYFREVLSSYSNGNYRSATVMLWSVVVSDLVYKLQHLRDIYNDPISESILRELEDRQQKNSTSAEWELYLVEEVKKRTQLLDNAEHQNLLNLQKNRHLSAHPVLNRTDILFSPNQESVRAMIRNTLEGVLLKPPILTKQIVTEFVTDIASKKELLIENEALKRYLETKYLKNLLSSVEEQLFRALWKFTFRLSNPEADANRVINYRALRIVFSRHHQTLQRYIQEHAAFFSEVGQGQTIDFLIRFLSEYPAVYESLTDAARVQIDSYANSSLDSYMPAFFLHSSFEDHAEAIIEKVKKVDDIATTEVNQNTWSYILRVAKESGNREKAYEIGIELYVRSSNFNTADLFFDSIIKPHLSSFSKAQLQRLLEGTEGNDQTYKRSQAYSDYKEIRLRIEELFGDNFDWSPYPKVSSRIAV